MKGKIDYLINVGVSSVYVFTIYIFNSRFLAIINFRKIPYQIWIKHLFVIFNRQFPEVCTVTHNVFCENPGGFLFLLVCLFMTLFISDSHNSVKKKSGSAFKFGHNPPLTGGKKWFFQIFEFRIFSRSKGQFSKISRSFFQNSDRGLKFWHNTVLIEHIKSCFELFRNFNFFKVKRSIFENFKVIFSK